MRGFGGLGGGGILGGGMDVGMEVPHMVHRPHMGNMRTMADDYDDDPNDPFPALTKSHAGGRMSANDQTVTVNIRGLGGRGPVQRAALDGGDDGFANIGMPAANANRPGGRRARGPNGPNFMAGTSITPSLAMAPHFTPTSINSMADGGGARAPAPAAPARDPQEERGGEQWSSGPAPARVCKYWRHGKCKYGSSCRFSHAEGAGGAPRQAAPRPVAGANIEINKQITEAMDVRASCAHSSRPAWPSSTTSM